MLEKCCLGRLTEAGSNKNSVSFALRIVFSVVRAVEYI